MRKLLLLVILTAFLLSCSNYKEDAAKDEILIVMKKQEKAWSNHDLESFMEGYWKNDSLKFYGQSGLTYGWDNTLANYKKNYPTQDHSGSLNFIIDDISKVEANSYFVMGQYFLKRKIGDANGVFLILFKKIDGHWKIVADMSC